MLRTAGAVPNPIRRRSSSYSPSPWLAPCGCRKNRASTNLHGASGCHRSRTGNSRAGIEALLFAVLFSMQTSSWTKSGCRFTPPPPPLRPPHPWEERAGSRLVLPPLVPFTTYTLTSSLYHHISVQKVGFCIRFVEPPVRERKSTMVVESSRASLGHRDTKGRSECWNTLYIYGAVIPPRNAYND